MINSRRRQRASRGESEHFEPGTRGEGGETEMKYSDHYEDDLYNVSLYPYLQKEDDIDPNIIKILIVGDGSINFGASGENHYSLSILVNALESHTEGPMRFSITKARRGRTREPDVTPNYKFSGELKERFHEIWLFGHDNSKKPEQRLSKEELEALSGFMDQGGGIFATGDHDDLGFTLCGEIPRVRSMRKWETPASPQFESEYRNDTLRKGDNEEYSHPLDEGDAVPQVLFPKVRSGSGTIFSCPSVQAHDLLCSPEGVLTLLPDHRHEGACVVPDNPGAEYPTIGKQELPQIVAVGRVFEPHVTRQKDYCLPVTRVDSFGAISAYDGHEVNVGRIVVDSSFHHFLDRNVSTFKNAPAGGMPGRGRKAYEQMERYYRNIAEWLMPKPIQVDVKNRSLLAARWAYPLSEELMTLTGGGDLEKLGWPYVLHIGAVTRATLSELASTCRAMKWASDLLRQSPGNGFLPLPDPWIMKTGTPILGGIVDSDLTAKIILGGASIALALKFSTDQEGYRDLSGNLVVSEQLLKETVVSGVQLGLQICGNFFEDLAQPLQHNIGKLKESLHTHASDWQDNQPAS